MDIDRDYPLKRFRLGSKRSSDVSNPIFGVVETSRSAVGNSNRVVFERPSMIGAFTNKPVSNTHKSVDRSAKDSLLHVPIRKDASALAEPTKTFSQSVLTRVKKCIICSADIKHVLEEEYSAHVNSCIDKSSEIKSNSNVIANFKGENYGPVELSNNSHNNINQSLDSLDKNCDNERVDIKFRSVCDQSVKLSKESQRIEKISKLLDSNATTALTSLKTSTEKKLITTDLSLHFSVGDALSKEDVELNKLRSELSDVLGKQADLKAREKKLKVEIKKLMKRSVSNGVSSSVPVQSSSVGPDLVPEWFFIPSGAVAQSASTPASEQEPRIWSMARIDQNFNETEASSKLSSSHFSILKIPNEIGYSDS